jgi:hypothetical protein
MTARFKKIRLIMTPSKIKSRKLSKYLKETIKTFKVLLQKLKKNLKKINQNLTKPLKNPQNP